MERTTQHAAIKHYFDFMVDAGDHSRCVAMKNKETGNLFYEGEEVTLSLIAPAFKTLQEACFYNFADDMKECATCAL